MRARRHLAIVAVLAVVTAMSASAAPAAENGPPPEPPPPVSATDDPGRIAFVRGEVTSELWTIDGTDLRRIALPLLRVAEPEWSPNGEVLAFAGADFRDDIYVVNADGSELRNLTNTPDVDEASPAWSPDGTQIAFVRAEDIWLMNADGSSPTNLTNSAVPERDPAWSPRGDHLVYARLQANSEPDLNLYDLWVTWFDDLRFSSNVTDTLEVSEVEPAWSPDGTSIAFTVYDPSVLPTADARPRTVDVVGNTDVYVMRADGRDRANLTATATPWEGDPAWSPDGSRLVFTRDPDPNAHGDTFFQSLWTMLPDGTGQIELTDEINGDRHPAWQPLPYVHPVGLVDPARGLWYLRHEGRVESFYYGDPGDYPMLGDWDCDGVATPGLYRQDDGFVYLRNANTQGIADQRFFFGDPGDVPLAGDFDGDGCDTVSLYRPGEGKVYVHNELGDHDQGLGPAEFSYYFGDPGDVPFAGDFDGDGVDTIGLHRDTTGLVYLRNSHTQGNADVEFIFGDPGDRFVAGDWTEDGVDTPAVFRPSDATFFFRNTNTQGPGDASIVFGEGDWLPVAGGFTLAPHPRGVVADVYLLAPQPAACDDVVSVPRLVTTQEDEPYWWGDLIRGAMTELVAGPTAAELAAGYGSWFSDATAGSFLGVSGELAGWVVDLADLRPIIPDAGSSCGALGFNAQLVKTAVRYQQYFSDCVSFAFEGDVDAYYEFTGLEPPECDP